MAMGRRAKKPAAEKPLAPGTRKISLYGLDIGCTLFREYPPHTYVAYVNEIIAYAAYVN
jgi:hypothetical protein